MNKVVPIATASLKRAQQSSKPARLTGPVRGVIAALRPAEPVYIIRPEIITQKAKAFMRAFPGETMFAVKTNPAPVVIQALIQAGMCAFDVASLKEIRLVRKISRKAKLYFMHTVKSPEAITEAYFQHGVRDFSLDTEEELKKIMDATGHARDLTLYVRLALPVSGTAAIDFSSKFGAAPEEAASLLRQARGVAAKLGVCFHVGTQATDPAAYARAVSFSAAVIRASGVEVDLLDVGGGFPASYPDQKVPPLDIYMQALKDALRAEGLDRLPLLAEPGRALVADGGSLVVRVELRKGNMLFLNDGTYGGLFDAGPLLNTRFPVEAIRPDGTFSAATEKFTFAGPTCDSLDMMAGPFVLPADIRTGDWIEIGNLGAYSQGMRTDFNGFGHADTVCLYG